MIKVNSLRHAWPEPTGFTIDRKNGHPHYTFLHFFNSITLTVSGKTIKTLPDACIIYSPNEPQYFKSDVPLVHDWIHFSCIREEDVEEYVALNRVFYPLRAEFITRLTAEAEREFFSEDCKREEMLDLKMRELFIDLKRSMEKRQTVNVDGETAKLFYVLRRKMFSELTRKQTVGDMAREVNLSESRFFAVYKSIFGISPVKDLIIAKMEEAKNSLAFGDMTVTSLADSLGYENITHFIRQFKQYVGCAPMEYKLRSSPQNSALKNNNS